MIIKAPKLAYLTSVRITIESIEHDDMPNKNQRILNTLHRIDWTWVIQLPPSTPLRLFLET